MIRPLFELVTALTFEATEVEVAPDGTVTATQLEVRGAGLVLSSLSGRLVSRPTCPQLQLELEVATARSSNAPTHPMTAPSMLASAASLTACLERGAVTLKDAELRLGDLELNAERLELRMGDNAAGASGHLEAWALSVWPCGCRPSPLSISSEHAIGRPSESLWLTWPVVRIYDVPVATLPRWELPLVARRSGLLFPEFGLHHARGAEVRWPYFWALHEAADVTFAPGYATNAGLTTRTRLRLATQTDSLLETRVSTADDALAVSGDGAARAAGLVFALEGEASSLAPSSSSGVGPVKLQDSALLAVAPYERGAVSTGVQTDGFVIGLGVERLDGEGPKTPALRPAAHLSLTHLLGPSSLSLDAAYDRSFDQGSRHPDVERFILETRAELPLDVGPLRLITQANAASGHAFADARSYTVMRGGALARAESAVKRAFGGLTHRVRAALETRVVTSDGRGPTELAPVETKAEGRFAVAELETSLLSLTSSQTLAVRASRDWADAQEPMTAGALYRLERGASEVRALLTTAGDARATLGLEPDDTVGLSLGATHLKREGATRLSRLQGHDETLSPPLSEASLAADAGMSLTLGPLTMSWRGLADLDANALLAQEGEVRYVDGCACWSSTLTIRHARGFSSPDVYLSLMLEK